MNSGCWTHAVLTLAMLAGTEATAQTVATRRECRAACAPLIDLCHEVSGARLSYCRRHVIRRCLRLGAGACEIDTVDTTTTIPLASTTTTTTLDPGPTVHGCNRKRAEDHRGEAIVTVEFIPFDYAPECIVVSPGTTVRFAGDFRVLPLFGGSFPEEDPQSPFEPPTRTGNVHTFVMSSPGLFPYYSETAWVALFRMWGMIIVE